jgi:lipoprotein-anchoring transpeptidase ErfK/SrfK
MRLKVVAASVALAFAMAAGSVAAEAAKVVISISKVSQKMTVTVDGEKKYYWLVSTGGVGYDTPSGTYHPFRLEKEHFSKEWDDAPMPYSMFFTGRGHAIHGSYHIKRLGTRASHGCVRLAPPNAATLFNLVQKNGMKNTTIIVKGGFLDGGDQLYSWNTKAKQTVDGLDKKARAKVLALKKKKKGKAKPPFWWLASSN